MLLVEMTSRMYTRRKKRPATSPLENILEEEIEYSEGISGHEEQHCVSGDNTNNDATRAEQEFVSVNDTNSGAMSSMADWDYKRPKTQDVNFYINYHCDEKIMTAIEERLMRFGAGTYNKFKKGPFWKLLKLPRSIGKCCKAIHYVISREIEFKGEKKVDKMELSYFINDTVIRFGRFEYALITGLRFGKSEFDPNGEYIVKDSFMWHRIFKRQKVKVLELLDRFLGVKGASLGDDPDDYVKAAKIIFVYTFLFGQMLKNTVIPVWMWVLVEYPISWNKFPWGSASFQMLLKYLHAVKEEPASRGGKESYHLFGFVYAFMAWIYCAIPEVGEQCGVPDLEAKDSKPRILRFTYGKAHPKFSSDFTQVFAKLSPTEDELLTKCWLSIEPEGAKVFDMKFNLDRSCGVSESQTTKRLKSSQADEGQPRDHYSSSHQHTTYVPGNVYYGPEDPIFNFAWSQRQTLIEQIGEFAASRAVEEIMKKVPYFEEYVRDRAEFSKGNEQDRSLNVDVSILSTQERWGGPTPQYNQTPGVPSVFHNPEFSEDQYPLKLQFREVKRRAEMVKLDSPFRPFDRRGNDYTKFLRSNGIKRNVGIGHLVDVSFFKDITDIKKYLDKHHIDAYLATIYTNPEFAGLKKLDATMTITSSSFLATIVEVWKNYHREDELSQCDPNMEEKISNKELNYLSQFVIGALPRWGKMKPWFDFNKVIIVVHNAILSVTLSIDLVEACLTIYDPTQNTFANADFDEKIQFFVPFARIFPQVLRYNGFYDARPDVVPNLGQWNITFPDESKLYKQGDSMICGAFALKQAEAILCGMMESFEQKDVKKYRAHMANTIYSFSTDEDSTIVD